MKNKANNPEMLEKETKKAENAKHNNEIKDNQQKITEILQPTKLQQSIQDLFQQVSGDEQNTDYVLDFFITIQKHLLDNPNFSLDDLRNTGDLITYDTLSSGVKILIKKDGKLFFAQVKYEEKSEEELYSERVKFHNVYNHNNQIMWYEAPVIITENDLKNHKIVNLEKLNQHKVQPSTDTNNILDNNLEEELRKLHTGEDDENVSKLINELEIITQSEYNNLLESEEDPYDFFAKKVEELSINECGNLVEFLAEIPFDILLSEEILIPVYEQPKKTDNSRYAQIASGCLLCGTINKEGAIVASLQIIPIVNNESKVIPLICKIDLAALLTYFL
ncbi:hypothetical protein AGMMS50249_0480 [candidate division SR1 bacterium]|nr:hypothetical protein AGMMS50249_0480 [candidate division SR1 bacterium]